MAASINGTRIVEQFDLTVKSSFDPNAKLKVVNEPKSVVEREKTKVAAQKKIALFAPEKLKNLRNKIRFEQIRTKRRKADVTEITTAVQKKIERFKRNTLQNSRFSEDLERGKNINVSS